MIAHRVFPQFLENADVGPCQRRPALRPCEVSSVHGRDAVNLEGIVTLAQYRRSLAVLARRRETQAIDFAHVGRGAATAIDK
jgi:type II secretory pathway component PulC